MTLGPVRLYSLLIVLHNLFLYIDTVEFLSISQLIIAGRFSETMPS